MFSTPLELTYARTVSSSGVENKCKLQNNMKPLKHLYVYILLCSDNTYYTGVTNNPEKRLIEHNTGENQKSYTFMRRPVTMIYSEKFSDYELAIKWEKRIKNWNRKKKEALINEKWDMLRIAAECKNETSHKNKNVSTPSHVLDSARTDTPQNNGNL